MHYAKSFKLVNYQRFKIKICFVHDDITDFEIFVIAKSNKEKSETIKRSIEPLLNQAFNLLGVYATSTDFCMQDRTYVNKPFDFIWANEILTWTIICQNYLEYDWLADLLAKEKETA